MEKEQLSLERFSPKKAEVIALAAKYKGLTIAGVDDKEGYIAVHKARMELVATRTGIRDAGKAIRADALRFQKAVISLENELISEIEPVEKDLEEKEKAIDEERREIKLQKMMEARERLDKRIGRLNDLGVPISEMNTVSLEAMSDKEYENILESARIKQEEVKAKEKEAEEQRKKEEEKLKEEKEAQRREAQRLELIAEEQRKKEEELKRKADEIKKEQEEIANKKRADEIREQERKRIEKELKEKQIAEEKEMEEKKKEEDEKLARNEKYRAFLVANGCSDEKTNDKDSEFFVEKLETKVILYRKVAELIF